MALITDAMNDSNTAIHFFKFTVEKIKASDVYATMITKGDFIY